MQAYFSKPRPQFNKHTRTRNQIVWSLIAKLVVLTKAHCPSPTKYQPHTFGPRRASAFRISPANNYKDPIYLPSLTHPPHPNNTQSNSQNGPLRPPQPGKQTPQLPRRHASRPGSNHHRGRPRHRRRSSATLRKRGREGRCCGHRC